MKFNKILLLVFVITVPFFAVAQKSNALRWSKDGEAMIRFEGGQLKKTFVADGRSEVLFTADQLKVNGTMIQPAAYEFSDDQSKLLVFTNAARVWRYNTRGDYWLFDKATGKWRQVGKGRPAQSLMFAKFSPDFSKIAYVSAQNIYVEDVKTGAETQLTTGGNRKLINGTFDWVYEEEFYCRDGFRWSPDSRSIAYWQVNAADTRDFFLINNTDSIYSKVIPVEYPKVGQPPSAVRIGVVGLTGKITKWMNVPGDAKQNYIPRIDWYGNEVIIQQLTRKQNETVLWRCNAASGEAKKIITEKDAAWIEMMQNWDSDYADRGFDWLNNGKSFLWASEKDGWRHLYLIDAATGKETLVTKGDFDVMSINCVDEKGGFVYFIASPENATQSYLFRCSLNGGSAPERLTPAEQQGSNSYTISPGAKYASHRFTNHKVQTIAEWISLPDHKTLNNDSRLKTALQKAASQTSATEYIKIKTADNIEMDALVIRPDNFDPSKKYPVVFYVYTEPAGQLVQDEFGAGYNFLYDGDISADGYFQIAIDNRGTPVPKGREWRKSIYRKVGIINIDDQAAAAREILKWKYIDPERVAVWGWSGGGSATLNLMFRYPEIYKTGIAIAAVANQLTYDNIYQERYMGLPSENMDDFIKGSPITYAKNLQGNLLYIHGTGDDNVHYQNAELLLNEMIRHNKQFRFFPYPNRTHGISEGEGTFDHLKTLYTQYLREKCPPGAK
ncbi:S9 family peptidase [Pollutibacter soli]|uniref:S9 family peptidase n=1 Tax=Pollutibacter soli TaxID=3034157 RepID=UPI0030133026